MRAVPDGTVTFLFTSIEGSTKLLQRLGDEYARALGEHQALLRAAFAAHRGAEVDTQGDAFFVAFATAPTAPAAPTAPTAPTASAAVGATTSPCGLNNLGVAARRRGDVAQSETLLREALAETAGVARQAERTARLLGAAAALRATLGAPLSSPEQSGVEQAVAAARTALGEVA